MRDKGWRVLTFVSLLFGVPKFCSLSCPKILLQLFEEEALFFRWINLMQPHAKTKVLFYPLNFAICLSFEMSEILKKKNKNRPKI